MSNEVVRKIEEQKTQEKFVELFSSVHKVSKGEANSLYKFEKFHFLNSMEEKGLMEKVTDLSAMGVFLDVVANGLSFSPQAKHVYVMSRSVKASSGSYEDRLYFQTQPDGKIFQAQKSGSIDYVTNPVIVYEGDEFAPCTNELGNQIIIIHKPSVPRKSQKIIAGYVYVVFKGGFREPTWMVKEDIDRLKGFSEKQNGRWDNTTKKRVPGNANALYTSGTDGQIDQGFFGAKLINAALKNVRKTAVPSLFEVEGEIEVEDTALPINTPSETPSLTTEYTF
jgi:recombinational DNA repair protein RecT